MPQNCYILSSSSSLLSFLITNIITSFAFLVPARHLTTHLPIRTLFAFNFPFNDLSNFQVNIHIGWTQKLNVTLIVRTKLLVILLIYTNVLMFGKNLRHFEALFGKGSKWNLNHSCYAPLPSCFLAKQKWKQCTLGQNVIYKNFLRKTPKLSFCPTGTWLARRQKIRKNENMKVNCLARTRRARRDIER